ncbi:DDE-type integrase/transposase/recombinase, partial [Anaerotignum lactatifermentans]|uniref:DDE-type integrase/transposase/recombinase n=1 Tax=Anaerotignum lactatifermentans TaxID=160404 RepID=UPI003FA4A90C
GKWYYLCIVMDLFSRKIISWNISGKPDVDLVMTAFKKAYKKRNAPYRQHIFCQYQWLNFIHNLLHLIRLPHIRCRNKNNIIQ